MAKVFSLLRLLLLVSLPLYILAAKLKTKRSKRLSMQLMSGYDATKRPTEGGNVTVVTLNVMLNDIISMNEGTLEASIKAGVWLYMEWYDPRLAWKPGQYPQNRIIMSPHRIWTPDIKLYNSLDPKIRMDDHAKVTISQDGKVQRVVPMWLAVHCHRPRMPNATWECPFRFGSWMYNGYDLDIYIRGDGFDLSGYTNKVWGITGNESARRVINRRCCREPWSQVSYTMRLIRR